MFTWVDRIISDGQTVRIFPYHSIHQDMDTYHSQVKKRHICETCNKCCYDASVLRKHALVHTGERPFVCQTCDKRFALESNLKVHNLIHTGERQFICLICDKRFTSASDLSKHEHIHSSRYICQMCNKRFTTSQYQHQHELIHTNERTYVCQMCNKRFKQAHGLYQHQRYHCKQRCAQIEMRHVQQIRCLVDVSCECDQLFYNRLETFWLILNLYIFLVRSTRPTFGKLAYNHMSSFYC